MTRPTAPLIVVMGVSGCGKTTVGARVAEGLAVAYVDADDLHSPSSIAAMRSGVPMTDADRRPWLDRIGTWLAARARSGAVASCSALRRAHRDVLRGHAPGTLFAHLDGSTDVIRQRMSARSGHFMPPSLLDSQIATLEPLEADERGWTLDLTEPVDVLVARCVAATTAVPEA